MGVFHIIYNEDNKSLINEVNLFIDGEFYKNLSKSVVKNIELENGKHRILITTSHISEINKVKGKSGLSVKTEKEVWVDEEIEISNEDSYYIFHSPLFVNGKGRIKKVSKEEFTKKDKSNKFWNSKLGTIIGIIIALIVLFIFS